MVLSPVPLQPHRALSCPTTAISTLFPVFPTGSKAKTSDTDQQQSRLLRQRQAMVPCPSHTAHCVSLQAPELRNIWEFKEATQWETLQSWRQQCSTAPGNCTGRGTGPWGVAEIPGETSQCLKKNLTKLMYKLLRTCYRGLGGKMTPGHVLHSKSRGAEETHLPQSPKVPPQGRHHQPTGLTSSLPALAGAPLPAACGEPAPRPTFCHSSFAKPWRLVTSSGSTLLL